MSFAFLQHAGLMQRNLVQRAGLSRMMDISMQGISASMCALAALERRANAKRLHGGILLPELQISMLAES